MIKFLKHFMRPKQREALEKLFRTASDKNFLPTFLYRYKETYIHLQIQKRMKFWSV